MRIQSEPTPSTKHPAIPVYRENAYNKLMNNCGCVLVNGEDALFENNEDTLVFALTDCSDSSRKDNANIHEWVDEYTDRLLRLVAELKPDEFEIQPLSGLRGYNRIVRMWWD